MKGIFSSVFDSGRSAFIGVHPRFHFLEAPAPGEKPAWSAAALHLKARDKFMGWSEEQRRQRLALVVNNARLCVLPDCHYPNLVSRFMKLMLGRLSEDWHSTWGHPVALAESFVDPELYRGTAYKVSGRVLMESRQS